MKILAFIGARGGSTGLPNKNILPLVGKPLLAWTVEAALGSKYIDRTVVSSDSPKILKIAEKYGAEVIKRPKALATTNAALEPSIFHVLDRLRKKGGYTPELIIALQPTSPQRDSKDIDRAVELFLNNQNRRVEAVISVNKMDKRLLTSFILNNNGHLDFFTKDPYPLMRRQALPDVYWVNGAIYLIKTSVLQKTRVLFTNRTLPYVMDEQKSGNIDTLDDLKKIEAVLTSVKK